MGKTVCAYLQGGLGNQCFIYATARALSIRAHAELRLNVDYFASDRVYRRHFELDRYRIAGICEPLHSPLWRIAQKTRYHAMKRMGVRNFGNYRCDFWPFVQEPFPTDWKGCLTLDGYWQSEFHYRDQADAIFDDFCLKDDSFLRGDPMLARIRSSRLPVFVHMRSYKEVPENDGSMAIPNPFYGEALTYLQARLGKKMTVFLFSDDLAWATARMQRWRRLKEIEVVPVEPFVGPSDWAGIRDFELLRLCHHGVVANSSFSRFAAWLGERQNLKAGRHPIYVHNCREKSGYCPERWHFVEDS